MRWLFSLAFASVVLAAPAQQAFAGPPPPPWLGDAPRASFALGQPAGAFSGFQPDAYGDPNYGLTVSPAQREQSRLLYLTICQASAGVPSGWTGSVAQGQAGATSQAFRDSVALRINYYRAMAGIPAAITLADSLNAKDQAAALMMSAKDALNHNPPSTWLDYTPDGALAAANSNLNLGSDGPDAIDAYIQDPGSSNAAAGHRRWVLYPPATVMGSGDVDGGGTAVPAANALWVIPATPPASPAPAARDGFVAWPPPGFVPYPLVFPRWSFSLPGVDLSAATVTMTSGGQPVPVRQEAVANGYGDNTLVWVPGGQPTGFTVPTAPAGGDLTYSVAVANVFINGAAQTFRYLVTVFDPAAPGADQVLPVVSGPVQATLGQASVYGFNAVPQAGGYWWTVRAVSPLALLLNAENGPGDVTVAPAGTNLLSAAPGQGGNACYQFASYPAESMTVNAVIVPAAGSALQFRSWLGYATAYESAAVQLSTDGGVSWASLYAVGGTGGQTEAGFLPHALDLSGYARQACRVRFLYAFRNASGGSYYPRSAGGRLVRG